MATKRKVHSGSSKRKWTDSELAGLPQRQKEVWSFFDRHRYGSAMNVAQAIYGALENTENTEAVSSARKSAHSILRTLESKGILKSFEVTNSTGRGAPETVFCLRDTKIPRSTLFVPHHLKINRCATIFIKACASGHPSRYSIDYLLEHDLGTRDEDAVRRPDLVFALKSDLGRGLFFCEIDLGTEPLHAKDRSRRADIYKKFEWYTHLSDSELAPYCRAFGYTFRGFRTVFITTRAKSIIRAAQEHETGDIIGIADYEAVTAETVLAEPIWTVPGYGIQTQFCINWCPEAGGG